MGSIASVPDFGSAQLGLPRPVCYGRVRVTGNLVIFHQFADNSRIAFQLLGEGEWDSIDALFINRRRVDHTNTTGAGGVAAVHFHPGIEGTLGAGLGATSTGGDQGVDSFFAALPTAIQPLTYSGMAYLALNIPADAGAPSPNLEVFADYRALKCRQFDAAGTQTAYAWTMNHAWHILDIIIRRWDKGPDHLKGAALTANEKALIDFGSFYAAAQWCDAVLASGEKRIEGSLPIIQDVPLGTTLEQLLNMSQCYLTMPRGKLRLSPDQVRASSFTLLGRHIVPLSFNHDETKVRQQASRIIGNYLSAEPPVQATVDTIANSGAVRAANVVTLKFTGKHPYVVNQEVHTWGIADNSFNGLYAVATVPDDHHITAPQVAADATSGGGFTGTLEQRFIPTDPVVQDHQQFQQAIGNRGPGLAPIRKFKKVQLDFGLNTGERVARLAQFLQQRHLGLDAAPWKAPNGATVRVFEEAVDDDGNALLEQLNGDMITVDKSVSDEYASKYELLEMHFNFGGGGAPSSDGSPASTADTGTVDLVLLEAVDGAITDTAPARPIVQSLPTAWGWRTS